MLIEYVEDSAVAPEGVEDRESVKQWFLSRGVTHLHYMAPLPTMSLIACMGILSFNARRQLTVEPKMRRAWKKYSAESIADPYIQDRREYRRAFGRLLHDYVPFYIGLHTPMQYVVTKARFAEQARRIAFAEVSIEKVFDLDGVCYSDGNAASVHTRFYDGPDGLNQIEWGIVLHENRCWSPDWKRWKAAEVLVPDRVPPECIDRYVVMNSEVADELAKSTTRLAKRGLVTYNEFEIVHNRKYFYSLNGERLEPND